MLIPSKNFFESENIDYSYSSDELVRELSQLTENKEEPEPEQQEPEPEPENKAADLVEEQKRKVFSYSEEAEMYVDLLDSVQELILPLIYNKYCFTPDEKEILKTIKNKIVESKSNKSDLTLDSYQQKLIIKHDDIQEDIKHLPFTENERKRLIKPLSRCLEIWQSSANPTTALIMAGFTVMLPRTFIIFQARREKL